MATLQVVGLVENTNDVLYTDTEHAPRVGRCSRSHFCHLVAESAYRAGDDIAAVDWDKAELELAS